MASIMKGDFVKMIYTEEIGQVVGWLDGETLIVEIEGVEFPVFTAHIVKTAPPKDKTTPVKSPPKNRHQRAADTLKAMGLRNEIDDLPDQGIHCLLQPFNDVDGDIKYFNIHLHNDTGKPFSFTYTCNLKNQAPYTFSKEMGGRSTMIVHSLEFDQLNDKPVLSFDFTLLKSLPKKQKSFSKVYKPKAKLVLQPTRHIAIVDAYVYRHTLFAQLPTKHKVAKKTVRSIDHELLNEKIQENQRSSNHPETIQVPRTFVNLKERIVDLHFEQLAKKYGYMPKRFILEQQLKHFEQELKMAISNEEDRMIVIHGLGKGRLKDEVFKMLQAYEEVCGIRNDYDPRFGFGATKILFEYVDFHTD